MYIFTYKHTHAHIKTHIYTNTEQKLMIVFRNTQSVFKKYPNMLCREIWVTVLQKKKKKVLIFSPQHILKTNSGFLKIKDL